MILQLIEEINALVITLDGESLNEKELEKLHKLSEEQLKQKINDLKLVLHGF